MPLFSNSIDGNTFDDLQGSIVLRSEEIQVFKRLGVNGLGARLTGSRGRPFKLISVKYVLDFGAAKDALVLFAGLKGNNPLTIIKQSVDYGLFLVLDVREAQESQAILNPVGTIIANAQVRQVLEWTFVG